MGVPFRKARAKEDVMKQPENMCNIRNTIVNNKGKKVVIRTNRGRNRFDVTEGVIYQTFPCVFMVQLDKKSGDNDTMTYSYTDVLTKEVELVF